MNEEKVKGETPIQERSSLEVVQEITEKLLKGDPHKFVSDMAYIKPQSPIHSPCDNWNSEQKYKLISREDLIRNYSYSFSDGRFYYAYTQKEIERIKEQFGVTGETPIQERGNEKAI